MGNKMQAYKKINVEKLKRRITKTLSTEEALRDVEPMCWSEEVMNGAENVIITRRK